MRGFKNRKQSPGKRSLLQASAVLRRSDVDQLTSSGRPLFFTTHALKTGAGSRDEVKDLGLDGNGDTSMYSTREAGKGQGEAAGGVTAQGVSQAKSMVLRQHPNRAREGTRRSSGKKDPRRRATAKRSKERTRGEGRAATGGTTLNSLRAPKRLDVGKGKFQTRTNFSKGTETRW